MGLSYFFRDSLLKFLVSYHVLIPGDWCVQRHCKFPVSIEMPLKRSHMHLVQFDRFSVDASNPMVDIRVLALITDFEEG